MPLIVIGLLIGLPLVLSVTLKSNAAIVFLALCTGSLLATFMGEDAVDLFGSFFPGSGAAATSAVQLAVLFLPAALTIVFLRGTVSGSMALFNILSAAATGVLAVLLAVPLLPPGTRYGITGTDTWSLIEQYQSVIVGSGALVSLLVLWTHKPKHNGRKKHH